MPVSYFTLGCLLWAFLVLPATAATSPQNPLPVQDALLVSYQGLHKFDRDTLSRQWSSLQGMQTFEPVYGEGLVYIGSSQGLYALDLASGEVVWHIEDSRTLFSPTLADQLYAGSLHGTLYAINPLTGTINWQSQASGWIYSPAVFPEWGRLWAGGEAHEALAFATRDGTLLQRIALAQESTYSPLAVGADRVAFTLFNGDTSILDAISGTQLLTLGAAWQPQDLSFDQRFFYRSQRNGALITFERNSGTASSYRKLVQQDLSLHPARAGNLLLSDLDSALILFDPKHQRELWRATISGAWTAPIQLDDCSVVYFDTSKLNPTAISAVRLKAPCN